jgi:hypothetical protein
MALRDQAITIDDQVATFIWFIKYVSNGLMYIWWLANNKWNLDMSRPRFKGTDGQWYISYGPSKLTDPAGRAPNSSAS